MPCCCCRKKKKILPPPPENPLVELEPTLRTVDCFYLQKLQKKKGDLRRYEVFTLNGQKVFDVFKLKSKRCVRCCCCCRKVSKMSITDSTGKEIVIIDRRCLCCGQLVALQTPPNVLMGYVEIMSDHCSAPYVTVYDEEEEPKVYWQVTDEKAYAKLKKVEFQMVGRDGIEEVGIISRKWNGAAEKFFGKNKPLEMCFPVQSTPAVKLSLIAAAVLVESRYMYKSEKKY